MHCGARLLPVSILKVSKHHRDAPMKTKADFLAFLSIFFVMMSVGLSAHPSRIVGSIGAACFMILGILALVGSVTTPTKRNTFNRAR